MDGWPLFARTLYERSVIPCDPRPFLHFSQNDGRSVAGRYSSSVWYTACCTWNRQAETDTLYAFNNRMAQLTRTRSRWDQIRTVLGSCIDAFTLHSYLTLLSATQTRPHTTCFSCVQIHAGADDLGQGEDEGSKASGNSGARIACCAIVICSEPADVWDTES